MANPQGGQPATYSFLVHSSSPSDASLRFDSPSSAKQRRRRTSPHDHAILEAAYQRNSKPDKKERAEIVNQVDLGEKEVQIWFQNRRQNDRRKSKPLEPHELLAHIRNTVPQLGPDTLAATAAADIARPASRSSSIHELLNPTSSADSSAKQDGKSDAGSQTQPMPTPPASFPASQRTGSLCEPSSTARGLAGHGRKRSHEVMESSTDTADGLPFPPEARTLPPLRKSSSFVRLAMTVDGAVKVRTNLDPTPSPPKQRLPPMHAIERRSNALTRSQSDLHASFDFRDVNPPVRRPGGAGFGRSRDARTWEFYCDRDSGDALTTQAEAERSGSAIGAINLIRSSSQRSKAHVLSPNLAKQNSRWGVSGSIGGKPKLARAKSSMGRLQNFDGLVDGTFDQPVDKTSNNAKRPRHERSSSGDSDKENWAPGTRASFNPLRRMHPSAPRSTILTATEDTSTLVLDPDVSNPCPDEQDPRNRTGPPSLRSVGTPGTAKRDDLDCIQGLLSLSQGAWR